MINKLLVNFVALHGGGTADACQMVEGLVAQGCEVYAILSKNMENYDRWKSINNLNIIEVNGYTNKFNFLPRLLAFMLFKLPSIKKMIKSKDIKYAYIPMITFWTYYIFKKLKFLKTIYTMHDVLPHDNKTKSLIWKWSEKLAYGCDDLVILSNCYKQVVQKYGKESAHVHVIPLGRQDYYGDVLEKNDNSDVFEFVFYGRIDDYKGLDILGKAFEMVLEKHKNVHLTIAASGDFSPYSEIYSKFDRSNVTLINRWILDNEVPTFFRFKKSITVLPYKNATQSGVIPIAMQHKSLIISTNCSGLKEQVENQKTGLLTEPNNAESFAKAMKYAIEHWSSMIRIIENAYSHIQCLSWDKLAKCLLEEINYDNN